MSVVLGIPPAFPLRMPCPPPPLPEPLSFASSVSVSKPSHALPSPSSNNSPHWSAISLSWRRCRALSGGVGVRNLEKKYFAVGERGMGVRGV